MNNWRAITKDSPKADGEEFLLQYDEGKLCIAWRTSEGFKTKQSETDWTNDSEGNEYEILKFIEINDPECWQKLPIENPTLSDLDRLSLIEEGDTVYDLDYNCFATVQKLKNGDLVHCGTGYKHFSHINDSWIKIDKSSLSNLLRQKLHTYGQASK